MKFFIRLVIRFYQVAISPFLHWVGGPGSGCRYEPTCSEYFLQAVDKHGALGGTILGLKRIGRCGPWGSFGADPVPPTKRELAEAVDADKHGDPTHG